MNKVSENELAPFHGFRFQVAFTEQLLGSETENQAVSICSGSFAECTGLEATMAPRAIVEGGRNWGGRAANGSGDIFDFDLKTWTDANKGFLGLVRTAR